MIKGLITALVAGALSLSATSFGAAPVIFNIPDVTVGDLDSPNCVGTGANFFVFTDAINLDNFVSDADTPKANLLWSFAEADDIADQDSINPSQWYTVNGTRSPARGRPHGGGRVGSQYFLHRPHQCPSYK